MRNEFLLLATVTAGVLTLLAIVLLAWRSRGQQRSAALREHFGAEYELALERQGSRARAERELASRRKRFDKLPVHLLSEDECDRFAAAWNEIQQRFVDDPSGAVEGADELVQEVMNARGYPLADFEQRVADLSIDHASVVQHYRSARALAVANRNGEPGTEELRKAMVYYRALFTDLLQTEAQSPRLHAAHA